MESDIIEPINLGSAEAISINEIVDLDEEIGRAAVPGGSKRAAPKGVTGRSSDNTLMRELLEWEQSTRLGIRMRTSYDWIASRMVS